MLFALFLVTVLLVQLCISSPIVQRLSSITVDDGTILNYALTLEYLERAFYRDGLAMFSRQDFQLAGYPDLFYDNLLEIYLQELTHVTFLTGALLAAGVQPTVELEYSFPMVDAQSFVTLASVFESLGTSAYVVLHEAGDHADTMKVSWSSCLYCQQRLPDSYRLNRQH